MRAYSLTSFGTPPALRDCPVPDPGPRQVQVAIAACGLNYADFLMTKGTYQDTPEPPFTLGLEVSGTVTALGESVTEFAVGDRIAVYAGQGGLAEYGVFDVARCVALPASMGFADAAAFQIAYGTSHVALAHRARLQPGETLLVLGAAGGVGLTAVEIGKLMGARVIACARGVDKLTAAKDAGADIVIDSDTDDLRAAFLQAGRADVVYDPVGGDSFKAAFRACNPEARLLAIGFASGEVPQIPANHLLVKNLDILGVNWGAYMRFRPDVLTESLATLIGWYDAGRLHPHISHTLPLADVADGLELLRSRKSTGKVVITM